MASTVRIAVEDHETLKELAKSTQKPMTDLIHDAIANLNRKFMLEATNIAYQAIRDDSAAWKAELADREAWDAASVADVDGDDWK